MKDPTLDPVDQVQQLFHIDGPHSADSIRDAAVSAAECIRYLNHATFSTRGSAIAFPVHVARPLASLNSLAHGMQQLLGQLEAQMARFTDTPGLYDDHGANPVTTATECRRQLREAQRALGPVATALTAAFERANRLGVHTSGEDA